MYAAYVEDRMALDDTEWLAVYAAIGAAAKIGVDKSNCRLLEDQVEETIESVRTELLAKWLNKRFPIPHASMEPMLIFCAKRETITVLRKIKSVVSVAFEAGGANEDAEAPREELPTDSFAMIASRLGVWRWPEYQHARMAVVAGFLDTGHYPGANALAWVPQVHRRAVLTSAIVDINAALVSLEAAGAA